jgi:hypothetical protein
MIAILSSPQSLGIYSLRRKKNRKTKRKKKENDLDDAESVTRDIY